eukprot:g1787.t1
MSGLPQAQASARKLYRDCLRLCFHIGGNSAKGQALKTTIRQEFRKNMNETDPTKIENLKLAAIRGLSNYLTLEAGAKDPRIAANMARQQRQQQEKEKRDDVGDNRK